MGKLLKIFFCLLSLGLVGYLSGDSLRKKERGIDDDFHLWWG